MMPWEGCLGHVVVHQDFDVEGCANGGHWVFGAVVELRQAQHEVEGKARTRRRQLPDLVFWAACNRHSSGREGRRGGEFHGEPGKDICGQRRGGNRRLGWWHSLHPGNDLGC